MYRLETVSKDLIIKLTKIDYHNLECFTKELILEKISIINIVDFDIVKVINEKDNKFLEVIKKIAEEYDETYFNNDGKNDVVADKYFKMARLMTAISFYISKRNTDGIFEVLYELCMVFDNEDSFLEFVTNKIKVISNTKKRKWLLF